MRGCEQHSGDTVAYVAIVLIASGTTCLLIWALAPVATRVGLVDRPGGRKRHEGEVPTIGGLALVSAVIVVALVMEISGRVLPAFWVGLLMIVLTGTIDDLREVGHQVKFLAQTAAAALMVFWAGWNLHSLGNLLGPWPLTLGVLGVPLTFVAVVGVVNAINFADGADGLAGGLVLNALFWIVVMEAIAGTSAGELPIVVAVAGAVAGFLAYNLPVPGRKGVRVFLGDAGSLGLGFVLAWFMVSAAERSAPLFAPVIAIWLLAAPLADTLASAGRRLLHRANPFKADRKHMHHILIDSGIPPRRAVAIILSGAFLLGGAGVAGWYFAVPEHWMFYLAMAVFAAYVAASTWALRAIEGRSGRSWHGSLGRRG